MAEILSWPKDPVKGDIYTFNGNYWVFDGCMWISTCCPGLCSIFDTGIILGVTIPRPFPGTGETPYTVKVCMRYQSSTGSWISDEIDPVDGSFLTIREDSPDKWSIGVSLGGIVNTMARLESSEPIGRWTGKGDLGYETVCGCTPTICACFYNEITDPIACEFYSNYFPVSFTGINGDTDAWLDFSNNISMVYNTTTLLWELYDDLNNLLYEISTTANPPLGDWTSLNSPSPEYLYLTTSSGDCDSCAPILDGLIVAFTGGGAITYIPLTWDPINSVFVSADGNIEISESPIGSGSWTLNIYGDASYTFQNHTPVGSWDKEITVLCGNTSIANSEGCLTAIGTENAALYLQENQQGGFGYGNPFFVMWQIICDAGSGTWSIQNFGAGGWVTYATATGSCSSAPFSLTWTVIDGTYTSYSFVSGPCPVV
jgi:hypothetical protein